MRALPCGLGSVACEDSSSSESSRLSFSPFELFSSVAAISASSRIAVSDFLLVVSEGALVLILLLAAVFEMSARIVRALERYVRGLLEENVSTFLPSLSGDLDWFLFRSAAAFFAGGNTIPRNTEGSG